MATFTKLDDNNIVLAVHALDDKVTQNSEGVEDENVGIEYLTKIHKHSNWKQTYIDKSKRKNYAGIGYTYDAARDAFISPQKFPSWILNEEKCNWDAPVTYPSVLSYKPDGQQDDKFYHIIWDEAGQKWTALDWETPKGSFDWNTSTLSWDSV